MEHLERGDLSPLELEVFEKEGFKITSALCNQENANCDCDTMHNWISAADADIDDETLAADVAHSVAVAFQKETSFSHDDVVNKMTRLLVRTIEFDDNLSNSTKQKLLRSGFTVTVSRRQPVRCRCDGLLVNCRCGARATTTVAIRKDTKSRLINANK